MNTQPASNSTLSAIARGSCQALARVMTIVSATAAATAMMTAAPRNARGRSRAVVRGLPETAWRGGLLGFATSVLLGLACATHRKQPSPRSYGPWPAAW
jgi:hypothetical protein